MIFIGVDPGLSGAIAVLTKDYPAEVFDIPTMVKGTNTKKLEIDPYQLDLIFKHILDKHKHHYDTFVPPMNVCLERVNSMPGQSAQSVFSLGDSFGTIRGVIAANRLPLRYVTPVTWKKHFKLGKEKEFARALATKLYPEAPLGLKKYADRAEALLIATYMKDQINGVSSI